MLNIALRALRGALCWLSEAQNLVLSSLEAYFNLATQCRQCNASLLPRLHLSRHSKATCRQRAAVNWDQLDLNSFANPGLTAKITRFLTRQAAILSKTRTRLHTGQQRPAQVQRTLLSRATERVFSGRFRRRFTVVCRAGRVYTTLYHSIPLFSSNSTPETSKICAKGSITQIVAV